MFPSWILKSTIFMEVNTSSSRRSSYNNKTRPAACFPLKNRPVSGRYVSVSASLTVSEHQQGRQHNHDAELHLVPPAACWDLCQRTEPKKTLVYWNPALVLNIYTHGGSCAHLQIQIIPRVVHMCGFTLVCSHVQQQAVMGRWVQGTTKGPRWG